MVSKSAGNAKLLADLLFHMIIKNDLIFAWRKKQKQLSSYPWDGHKGLIALQDVPMKMPKKLLN